MERDRGRVPGRGAAGVRRGDDRGAWRLSGAADVTVQIFGHERDQGTRAAIRFFKERRVGIHLVDLTRKPIAKGELRRFVDRFGARALFDESSKGYRDGGLGYLRMDDSEMVERLLRDQTLLRLPLVRFGNDVAVGRDEATWKRWFKPAGA